MDVTKNIWLPLNLQFFADDNEAENPSAKTEVKEETTTSPVHEEQKVDKKVEVKTFTQEDLNKIDAQAKAKTKEKIYKMFGVSNEEELLALAEKSKGFKAIEDELSTLKAENLKNGYLKAITSQNVADEYVENIYSMIPPKDNEKADDYKTRVEEYLKTHQAFLKTSSGSTKTINSNIDYKGTNNPSADEKLRSYFGLKTK